MVLQYLPDEPYIVFDRPLPQYQHLAGVRGDEDDPVLVDVSSHLRILISYPGQYPFFAGIAGLYFRQCYLYIINIFMN